ncbi:hypothetical protein [Bacteroides gallinarum]|uniref:hypothetical protein n=1 Tax=Bacteroides gallinarum TaxID=376806 RepID=UPI00037102AB|nr:hypothetical protein [Bacteroides gallinarum]
MAQTFWQEYALAQGKGRFLPSGQPLHPAFVPKVFGINSGRLKFAQENTPGGKGMSASGKESVQLDNCQHIKGWQSGTVALTFS